jgi:glycosyltransferase involved in cell wall biosynthesis
LQNPQKHFSRESPKVLEIITLFSIGGATETVISITSGMISKLLKVEIVTGSNVKYEGDMYEEANKLGINVITIPTLQRNINIINDFITLIKLYKIIKKGKYDVVHTHSSKAGILGRWAARFAGVNKIIHTVHGWGFNNLQTFIVNKSIIILERVTAHITTQLVCVSYQDISKGISKKIGKTGQYVVIRSGINIEKFSNSVISKEEIKSELNLCSNDYIIGTITRFSDQKAPMDTIRAFNEIVKRGYNDVKLIMVGDGPLLNESKRFSKRLGIDSKIIFTGIRNDIPTILKTFDVFVLSSRWEGLPRVIPQAIASGIPVVATMIDGNAEIIKHKQNGILVEPGNPVKLGESVIWLMKNLDEAKKMVYNAKLGLSEFDEKRMIEDTFNLYTSRI